MRSVDIFKPQFRAARQKRRLLEVVLLTMTAAGCGESRLDVAPVRGQVTYGGRGVAGATVIFHPQQNVPEAAQKMRPYAFADGEGRFELKTYIDGDGVPPGDYRVSISFAAAGPPGRHTDGAPADTAAGAKPPMNIPNGIRQKYSKVETAGINVTVQEGQNELAPIELK